MKKSALIIGTTGTETPFLSESEIPEHAKLNIKDHAMTQDEDRDLAEALSKSAESGEKQINKLIAKIVSQ